MDQNSSESNDGSNSLSSTAKLRLPSTTDPPGESNPPTQKVWIIFGATGHIGRSLVKAALSHGDQVTAVGRTTENTMAQMQNWHDNCLGMLCDVRARETVNEVFRKSLIHWGRMDIIVNCTGYGVIGSCEDQDTCDLRSQFETNFLGTLNIIQLSLPHLREAAANRKDHENAGRYVIFSSTSGALGVPGLGPYCATKYATEGLIESMLYEIDAFGIKASLVEPGHVRLDKSTGLEDKKEGGTATNGNRVKVKMYGHFLVKSPSAPYDTPTAPAGHARRVVQWLADRQPTSAIKAAELVWQLGHCRYPPLRLLLGTFAVESIRDRLKSITEEIEDWKHLSFQVSADETSDEKTDKRRSPPAGDEDDLTMMLDEDAMDVQADDFGREYEDND